MYYFGLFAAAAAVLLYDAFRWWNRYRAPEAEESEAFGFHWRLAGISAQPIDPDIARLFHLPVKHGLLVDTVDSGSGAVLSKRYDQ